MPITVKKISEDRYLAKLTLPDMKAVKAEWSTADPLSADQLVNELLSRGCHPIDIADAMSEQDPKWIEKSPDRHKTTWPFDPTS
ncbi:MAG TPA: hypothetical protein VFW25_05980 [Silvibacterium sp.]|nr:hypothetical protein [Silvibacterium sp.]